MKNRQAYAAVFLLFAPVLMVLGAGAYYAVENAWPDSRSDAECRIWDIRTQRMYGTYGPLNRRKHKPVDGMSDHVMAPEWYEAWWDDGSVAAVGWEPFGTFSGPSMGSPADYHYVVFRRCRTAAAE